MSEEHCFGFDWHTIVMEVGRFDWLDDCYFLTFSDKRQRVRIEGLPAKIVRALLTKSEMAENYDKMEARLAEIQREDRKELHRALEERNKAVSYWETAKDVLKVWQRDHDKVLKRLDKRKREVQTLQEACRRHRCKSRYLNNFCDRVEKENRKLKKQLASYENTLAGVKRYVRVLERGLASERAKVGPATAREDGRTTLELIYEDRFYKVVRCSNCCKTYTVTPSDKYVCCPYCRLIILGMENTARK